MQSMRDAFLEEKSAMIRGTAGDCIELREQVMQWQDVNVYTEFRNALEGDIQLEEPSEYVTIRK